MEVWSCAFQIYIYIYWIVFQVAGHDLTRHLIRLVTRQQNISPDDVSTTTVKMFKEIKEEYTYVALDFEHEILKKEHKSKSFRLPDGFSFNLGTECFRCREILFRPSFADIGSPGIHECCDLAIKQSGADNHWNFYTNILLAGGTTMCQGFDDRLEREMSVLGPPTSSPNVVAPHDRENSVWLGGSILTSLSTFQSQWVTRKEYEEYGSSIVQRKFRWRYEIHIFW